MIGCEQSTPTPPPAVPVVVVRTLRQQEGWQAADFFADETALRICAAISSRDEATLNREIEGKADLNVRGEGGFTLLHWAFAEENMAAFEALLKGGASPDLVLSQTILGKMFIFLKDESVIFTSMRCYRPRFGAAALPYSKNVNQKRGKDNLLHVFFQTFGSSKKILEDLIAAGIDVNAVGSYGYTPCHHAAYKRPEFCIPLVEAGADPSIRDDEGRDVLAALQFERALLAQVDRDTAKYDEVIAWLKARTAEGSSQP
jgi:hypothetical protein